LNQPASNYDGRDNHTKNRPGRNVSTSSETSLTMPLGDPIAAAGARAVDEGRKKASSRNATLVAWTLTILFVTATAELVAIVITWLRVAGAEWPQPATIAALSLAFAIQALGALVCGLGRMAIAFRAWVFFLTALVSGYLLSRGPGGSFGNDLARSCLFGLLVLAGCWLIRARGWSLALAHETQVKRVSPWQFQLLHMFCVTTLAAVVLGLFRWYGVQLPQVVRSSWFYFWLSLIPLGAMFGLLSRWRGTWVVMHGFATVLVVFLAVHQSFRPVDLASLSFLLVSFSLTLHAALAIVRLAGYRLIPTAPCG
jgi:hypothetical protein